MTDRKHLPVALPTRNVTAPTGQLGSLAARGLVATNQAQAEKLFRLGMRYRYDQHADEKKAFEFFAAAAELDHAEALVELVVMEPKPQESSDSLSDSELEALPTPAELLQSQQILKMLRNPKPQMSPQGRKIWGSPQGQNLMSNMLNGKPLTPQDKMVVQALKKSGPPNVK